MHVLIFFAQASPSPLAGAMKLSAHTSAVASLFKKTPSLPS
jgi:hypothetical protein